MVISLIGDLFVIVPKYMVLICKMKLVFMRLMVNLGVVVQVYYLFDLFQIVHLDAFAWVKRDSYLPHGSQGLKAVTRAKLGYDPIEINAEDMLKEAIENPFYMASYSVSDAVATYYLYMKYVHLFIYSLCTVIPLNAEDVLRKGSGTLCEMLLMVESYNNGIIYPNKQTEIPKRFYNGHLLEQDTYIGGTVECLESGVYRNDLPSAFDMDPTAYEELIASIDRMLTFSIEMENGVSFS